jgi:hypothetical protein
MPWVEDPRLRRLKDTVLAALRQARNELAAGANLEQSITNGARTTIGVGHPRGERIIHAAQQAENSTRQAESALTRAETAATQINTLVWVDEGQP